MKEPECATDKFAIVHRSLSLLIVGGVFFFAITNGKVSIARSIMSFFVPIS